MSTGNLQNICHVEKLGILSFTEGTVISKKMVVPLAVNYPVKKVLRDELEMSSLLVCPFSHTGASVYSENLLSKVTPTQKWIPAGIS